MTMASLGLAAAGGLVQAGSSFMQGQSASDQYNYKAGVALTNKRIAEQNRDYAFAAGGVESERFGVGAAQRMGNIKTSQAASGINVNTGSAKMVQDSQHAADITTEGQIRANAARRAYGFQVQATNFDTEASMDRTAASNAKTAGTIGAVSSLLSGATSVASKWYQGTQSGLFGSSSGDPWKGMREGDVGQSGSSYYSMS